MQSISSILPWLNELFRNIKAQVVILITTISKKYLSYFIYTPAGMALARFRADLQKSQQEVKPTGIFHLEETYHAQFEVHFALPVGSDNVEHPPFKITAAVQNVEQYPNGHDFITFCEDDNAPDGTGNALGSITHATARKTVSEFLQIISGILCQPQAASEEDISITKIYRDRLSKDVDIATKAGFEVGLLGPIMDLQYGGFGFVTVSIPMIELGISEEVMQTWEVDPTEFLTLLLHYPQGYKTYEELQDYDKSNIGMRVVAGKYNRPTMTEAVNAFARTDKIADYRINENTSIRDIFISKHLSTLLEESLVPILRFRNAGLDWHGAEAWFSDSQAKPEGTDLDAIPDEYFKPEENTKIFTDIVTDDHFAKTETFYSFPLIAMQFVLRHFVRCTEFCLTCHRKLDLELEAIKPHFCADRQCLYKYLDMGLIEYEIIHQPYVVDLLVSFCYSSARAGRLNNYPDNFYLKVPFVPSKQVQVQVVQQGGLMTLNGTEPSSGSKEYSVVFNYEKREVVFQGNEIQPSSLKKDSWVVIKVNNLHELHCRVARNLFPTVVVDEPIVLGGKSRKKGKVRSTLTIYDQDFDKMDKGQKDEVICKLLDTLPTVTEMRNYLGDCHPDDLKGWVQRFSPAALRLFRWIIASNRACLMQVDGDNTKNKRHTANQDRLFGMPGYMQFRFAMGAPDKEQRFLNEVRTTTERLQLTYPTMFAWHGSPIYNWHTIIREGLNFDKTANGRVYGNGVYHALDARFAENYSVGIPGLVGGTAQTVKASDYAWPNSILNISSALALNEIVNAPQEFVSSNPYYVISHLDWIQTRYLLVKCNPVEGVQMGKEEKPSKPHPQDPGRTPIGVSGGSIVIPASAIKSSRAAMPKERKKRHVTESGEASSSGTTVKKTKRTVKVTKV